MIRGIVLGFVLAGIVGYTLNRFLWKQGLGPVHAFFKPQVVVHRTKKSPFQVFLGCLARIAMLLGFAGGLLWLGGVALGVEPELLDPVASALSLADRDLIGLLLIALMALLIALGLRASSSKEKGS
jgi:hypothetical protein